MKIGILGTGNIGKTLVVRLSQAGHEVKVANSRGPETIDKDLLSSGALAVTTENALTDVEAVILSIPLNRIADIAPLVAGLPAESRFLAQATWLFVLSNAAISGVLSAENDRYGGRAIWLILLVALTAAVQVDASAVRRLRFFPRSSADPS